MSSLPTLFSWNTSLDSCPKQVSWHSFVPSLHRRVNATWSRWRQSTQTHKWPSAWASYPIGNSQSEGFHNRSCRSGLTIDFFCSPDGSWMDLLARAYKSLTKSNHSTLHNFHHTSIWRWRITNLAPVVAQLHCEPRCTCSWPTRATAVSVCWGVSDAVARRTSAR